jgi:hypothetical protein
VVVDEERGLRPGEGDGGLRLAGDNRKYGKRGGGNGAYQLFSGGCPRPKRQGGEGANRANVAQEKREEAGG